MNLSPIRQTVAEAPKFHCGPGREWPTFSAQRMSATAGRHLIRARPVHRLVFYERGGVASDCSCGNLHRIHTLLPGSFDLIPAETPAFWEDVAPVDFVVVRLPPALLTATAKTLALGGCTALAPQIGVQDPLVEQLVRAIDAEIEAACPAVGPYAEGLAGALAARLLHGYSAVGAPRRRSLSKPQLRRLVAHIEQHLAEDLSLPRLAAVLELSVPHLTAMFRRTTGQSVHRYVMERRVHRARALLLEGRLPIAQIAAECGFCHQSHLARWTQRVLGTRPLDMRSPGGPG